MEFNKIKGNIFKFINKKDYIAHCISSDCQMQMGFAFDVERIYKIKHLLLARGEDERNHPTCIREKTVFNLITKKYYWGKPTYKTLRKSLEKMKELMIEEGIEHISIPKIGTGLDKLQWSKVEEIIKDVFKDTDIKIDVYYFK